MIKVNLPLLYIILCVLFANATYATTPSTDNKNFQNILEDLYGAPVKLNMNNNECKIQYSKVEVVEKTPHMVQPENPEDKPRMEVKTITSYIPETTGECSQIEDFEMWKQYQIINTSSKGFLARMYNFLHMPFFKDIKIGNFEEKIYVVPQINLVSFIKTNVSDIVYGETDKNTGLQREIGNLKNLTMNRNIKKEGKKIIYNDSILLNNLNFVSPMFTIHLNSVSNKTDGEFSILEKEKFDTQSLDLIFSKTETNINNFRFDLGLFGIMTEFNVNVSSYIRHSSKEYMDIIGELSVNNINISGKLMEAKNSSIKNLKNISLKYGLKNINTKNLGKLKDIKNNELKNNEKVDEAEKEKIIDEIINNSDLLFSLKSEFTNGKMGLKINVKVKNGYLVGKSNFEAQNLYDIFPEFKKCLNNPDAQSVEECKEGSLFDSLSKYIDMNKNSSSVIFDINEKGVFLGQKKIGDPIELNSNKMKNEKDLKKETNLKKQIES